MQLQEFCTTEPHWGTFDSQLSQLHQVALSPFSFSLQLCFSSDACSTPNSWRTRNQRHRFMVGWRYKNLVPICL